MALLMALLMAGPAAAHSPLVVSTPADGARLPELPSLVDLEFDGALAGRPQVSVTDVSGREHGQGAAAAHGTHVVQALTPGPSGAYRVAYRVASRDGHVSAGVLHLTVSAGAVADPALLSTGLPTSRAPGGGRAWALGTASALLLIVPVFAAWLRRRRAR